MKVHPFLSVITVSYNSERFIDDTIKSVLQQDFLDYEYIIVDGQSKDSTMDIIRSYETKFDGRMRWISEPDKGIYDAMNKGISMAKGRLAWLVNSDDYIQPGSMQEIYNIFSKFEESKWPIISFAYNRIGLDGSISETVFFDAKRSKWCEKRDYMGVLHPATIVPIEVYKRHELYDTWYKVIADLDWYRRMIAAGEKIDFVNRIITNMRDGGASATHYYKDRIREYRYYCFKNYSFFEATIRFLRLWLQQVYGHFLRKLQ